MLIYSYFISTLCICSSPQYKHNIINISQFVEVLIVSKTMVYKIIPKLKVYENVLKPKKVKENNFRIIRVF